MLCSVAAHLQEKRQKLVAALYTYSSSLTRKATLAWLLYLQHRQTKAQQWQRAARHYVLRRKAVCFGGWLRTARYLVPLRRNMGRLHTKVTCSTDTDRWLLLVWLVGFGAHRLLLLCIMHIYS